MSGDQWQSNTAKSLWKCQFIGHSDALEVLIVDDVILICGTDAAADTPCICFQELNAMLTASLALVSLPKPVLSNLPLPGSIWLSNGMHQSYQTCRERNRIYFCPGVPNPSGNQRITALLRNRNILFFKGFVVRCRRSSHRRTPCHPAFQLFLYTPTHFQRKAAALLPVHP